jgi:S-adenosylmethionine synthetase
VVEPVSIYVDTFDTGTVQREDIIAIIKDNFDLSSA